MVGYTTRWHEFIVKEKEERSGADCDWEDASGKGKDKEAESLISQAKGRSTREGRRWTGELGRVGARAEQGDALPNTDVLRKNAV